MQIVCVFPALQCVIHWAIVYGGYFPSVAGSKAPTVPPVQTLQAQNSTLLNSAQAANKEKANPKGINDATTANNI